MAKEPGLTLYHYDPSFYSQKVRLAFAEKGVKYKSHLVALGAWENWEPWFMRINPKGQIPTLDTGREVFSDSNDIIRYLDKAYPAPYLLIPTDDSPRSKQVRHLHEQLDSVNIPSLSYGSFFNPDLVEAAQIPRFMARMGAANMGSDKTPERLRNHAKNNPDLREVYEAKIADHAKMKDSMVSREKVEASLTHLKSVLDEVEQQLASQATEECPWLGGSTFSIADICLALTLQRMKLVGYSRKLWERGQRPCVAKYYTNLLRRPTFVAECVNAMSGRKMLQYIVPFITKKIGKPLLLTSVLGVAVAVGIWWYKTKQ